MAELHGHEDEKLVRPDIQRIQRAAGRVKNASEAVHSIRNVRHSKHGLELLRKLLHRPQAEQEQRI